MHQTVNHQQALEQTTRYHKEAEARILEQLDANTIINHQRALEQAALNQEAAEKRIFDQLDSNTVRMEARLQDIIEAGDNRSTSDRQQMLREMDAQQRAMEDRITRLIGGIAITGGQSLGDVENLLQRQREIEADRHKGDRLAFERQ